MQTRLAELDRIAGDLANVMTPGYKVERAGTLTSERGDFATTLDAAVDVVPGQTKIDFRPGMIATTNRDLDVAIDGKGFFVVDTGDKQIYTRDGAFTRRADGVLVTADGDTVMGESGEIKLAPGEIHIDSDGTIHAGTTVAGKLRIVEFTQDTDLVRQSGAKFLAIAGASPSPADKPKVIAGALEQSNASVVDLMAKLTEVSRGFDSLQRGVSTFQNELDSKAITELTKR
jgi:flagellar basal body rod protein FlgG